MVAASDALRTEIIDAIHHSLRPGGLVCVTYKTTVGWIEIAPVQRIMRHVAQRYIGHPDGLVPHVLDLLDQLRKGGAKHLTERPAVGKWLDELATTDPASHRLRVPLRRVPPDVAPPAEPGNRTCRLRIHQ